MRLQLKCEKGKKKLSNGGWVIRSLKGKEVGDKNLMYSALQVGE